MSTLRDGRRMPAMKLIRFRVDGRGINYLSRPVAKADALAYATSIEMLGYRARRVRWWRR